MASSAAEFVPGSDDWEELRAAALGCRGCELWENATQTVFGEGDLGSRLMLVGEQPGDKEDLIGRPFVGPAGRVLEEALAEAGIDREAVYVTNAVKHFHWRKQSQRRLHEEPRSRHVAACRPWLEKEIEIVRPRVVVCLGATAAQALLGPDFRVTRERGKLFERPGLPPLSATVHPSSILRAPDESSCQAAMSSFVADLAAAGRRLPHR
ncbi:MAG TPA: UdgX family uracil-DNA binding protein [Candidatus Dormibacteraeota bacterium]|nr:UdgX family uracil-DNA binding protein [Candidatus Dormibacteraeota bacterium]